MAPSFRGQRSRYRHTLAHEIALITCKCGSESQAEELASKIERMPSPTALAKADPAGGQHNKVGPDATSLAGMQASGRDL